MTTSEVSANISSPSVSRIDWTDKEGNEHTSPYYGYGSALRLQWTAPGIHYDAWTFRPISRDVSEYTSNLGQRLTVYYDR